MKTIMLLVCLSLLALTTGCASVTGGKNQPISVQTSCGKQNLPGADCKLTNDKGEWYVRNTPGSVTIQKAYGDLAIECEKTGVGKGVGVYKSSANGGVFGNIIVGGLIGYAIDAGSGAGFDYPQAMRVDVCNGETRPDVTVSASVTKQKEQWMAHASGYAKSADCAAAGFGPVATAHGAERYQFQCPTRKPLYLECMYGSCKEIEPF